MFLVGLPLMKRVKREGRGGVSGWVRMDQGIGSASRVGRDVLGLAKEKQNRHEQTPINIARSHPLAFHRRITGAYVTQHCVMREQTPMVFQEYDTLHIISNQKNNQNRKTKLTVDLI